MMPLDAVTLSLCLVSLLFFFIVGIMMFFSFAAIRYRRTKYQDAAVLYRWLFIPLLFPLRLCYELVRLVLRLARWLLFVGVGLLALLFSPFYFLVVLPMADYNSRLSQAMNSFERFVELFRSEIRLGQWLMFYPPEPINAEIEIPRRAAFGSAARSRRTPAAQPPDHQDPPGSNGA